MDNKEIVERIMEKVNVGDIYYGSFGYDMTLYDFYEVVGKTKSSLRLRELKKKRLNGQLDNLGVQPIPGEYAGETFLKRVDKFGCLRIDGTFVHLDRPWKSSDVLFENHMD